MSNGHDVKVGNDPEFRYMIFSHPLLHMQIIFDSIPDRQNHVTLTLIQEVCNVRYSFEGFNGRGMCGFPGGTYILYTTTHVQYRTCRRRRTVCDMTEVLGHAYPIEVQHAVRVMHMKHAPHAWRYVANTRTSLHSGSLAALSTTLAIQHPPHPSYYRLCHKTGCQQWAS